jgi:putative nucleotidyltransferase with HDIG domain
MRVAERMQSPTATIEEISNLIRSDVGLTAKVLRLANSSYYSIPGGVSDVQKALQFLGFNTIAQLVLTSSVFGAFKGQGSRDFPLSSFWSHSFAVGLLSELTARNLQLPNPSVAFVGGLMHDTGKLILMELAPDQLSKIVHHARDAQKSFLDSETELGESTHVELGAALARYWKLPNEVVSIIEQHHSDHASYTEARIVAWANVRVRTMKIGHSGNHAPDAATEEEKFETVLGMTEGQKQKITEFFLKEFEKAGAILNGN